MAHHLNIPPGGGTCAIGRIDREEDIVHPRLQDGVQVGRLVKFAYLRSQLDFGQGRNLRPGTHFDPVTPGRRPEADAVFTSGAVDYSAARVGDQG